MFDAEAEETGPYLYVPPSTPPERPSEPVNKTKSDGLSPEDSYFLYTLFFSLF